MADIPNYQDTDPNFDVDRAMEHKNPSFRIRALLHPLATHGHVMMGLSDRHELVREWARTVYQARFDSGK